MSQKELLLSVRAKDADGVPQLYQFNVVGTRNDGLNHVKRVAEDQGWSDVHVHDYEDALHMELHNAVMTDRGEEPVYAPEDIAAVRTPAAQAEITDHGKPAKP